MSDTAANEPRKRSRTNGVSKIIKRLKETVLWFTDIYLVARLRAACQDQDEPLFQEIADLDNELRKACLAVG